MTAYDPFVQVIGKNFSTNEYREQEERAQMYNAWIAQRIDQGSF